MGASVPHNDVFQEVRDIEAIRGQRERVAARVERYEPHQVIRMAGLAKAIPWARPGIIESLGAAGYGPNSEIVKWVAQTEARIRSERNGWTPIGEHVRAPGSGTRSAVEAADAAGLIDKRGYLTEPGESDNPGVLDVVAQQDGPIGGLAKMLGGKDLEQDRGRNQREQQRAWQRVIREFEAAGKPLPFIDENGERAILGLDPDDWWRRKYVRNRGGTDVLTQRSEKDERIDARQMLADQGNTDAGAFSGAVGTLGIATEGIQAPGSAGGVPALSRPQVAQQGLGALGQDPLGTADVLADTAFEGTKTGARAAAMAMDAPVQEVQGLFRNAYAAASGEDVDDWWQWQSDLGIWLSTKKDPGEGFLVGDQSELAIERRRVEADRGQIGGHNITIGRGLINLTGLDPGSTPYNILSGLVDMGVQVYGDPTTYALGGLGKMSKARGLFATEEAIEAAGGYKGLRRFVAPTKVSEYFDSNTGRNIINNLVEDKDPWSVYNKLNRNVEIEEALDIAETTNPARIRGMLEAKLGREIRHKDDLWSDYNSMLGGATPRSAYRRRIRQSLPGTRVDLDNGHDFANQMDLWMGNAKFSDYERFDVMDKVMRTTGRNERWDILQDVMKRTNGILERAGWSDPRVRDDVTKLYRGSGEGVRDYFIDEVGEAMRPETNIIINGETKTIGPSLYSEMANNQVGLPEFRTIRRMLIDDKAARFILTNPNGEMRTPQVLLHWLQDDIWKPAQLLRAAYTVRVVGEEQFRMAAAGLESIIKHPFSALSWATGKKGNLDVEGRLIDSADEFAQANYRIGGQNRAPRRYLGKDTQVYYKNKRGTITEFFDGWADEIATLHKDPVAHYATTRDLDSAATAEWLMTGGGRGYRKELADAGIPMSNLAEAQAYVDNFIIKRINIKTGGHTDLIDAIRTGKLRGNDLITADGQGLNKQFKDALGKHYGDSAPDAVVGRTVDVRAGGPNALLLERMDNATNIMFGWLMGKPSNFLSRAPAFRQRYWERVAELTPWMDEATRTRVLASAEEAGLNNGIDIEFAGRTWRGSHGKRTYRKIARTRVTDKDDLLDIEAVDKLAKGYALDETRSLLYDMNERGQLSDMLKLVAPFGEAWKEMVTRWADLFTTGPVLNRSFGGPLPRARAALETASGLLPSRNARRLQQTVQGARGAGFGEVMGAPEIYNPETGDYEQKGFFYKNQWGEEVFVYPGSEWLTEKLMDVPIPMTGRVGGLNMMSQVLPGVGPAVQIPLAWYAEDKPELSGVQELLLPYGTPIDADNQSGIGQALNFAPTWARRMAQGLTGGGWNEQSDISWNNAVMEMATYLQSTGGYDMSTRAGQQRLLEDARARAKKFFFIQSAAVFGAPTAPAPEWLVETPDDGLVATWALRDEYWRLREENFETADFNFLNRFGTDLALVMQSRSRTINGGVQATSEFQRWALDNQELATKYPAIYGYFGPQEDADGEEYEHNQAIYLAQIRKKERVRLTPEEWLRASNHTLGSMIYRRYTKIAEDADVENNPGIRLFMNQLRQQLAVEYPGYGDFSGQAQRPDWEAVEPQLREIVNEPSLKDSPTRDALATWLAYDSFMTTQAQSMGLMSWRSSQATLPHRLMMNQVAERLAARDHNFGLLYDRVIAPQIEDDAATAMASTGTDMQPFALES